MCGEPSGSTTRVPPLGCVPSRSLTKSTECLPDSHAYLRRARRQRGGRAAAVPQPEAGERLRGELVAVAGCAQPAGGGQRRGATLQRVRHVCQIWQAIGKRSASRKLLSLPVRSKLAVDSGEAPCSDTKWPFKMDRPACFCDEQSLLWLPLRSKLTVSRREHANGTSPTASPDCTCCYSNAKQPIIYLPDVSGIGRGQHCDTWKRAFFFHPTSAVRCWVPDSSSITALLSSGCGVVEMRGSACWKPAPMAGTEPYARMMPMTLRIYAWSQVLRGGHAGQRLLETLSPIAGTKSCSVKNNNAFAHVLASESSSRTPACQTADSTLTRTCEVRCPNSKLGSRWLGCSVSRWLVALRGEVLSGAADVACSVW